MRDQKTCLNLHLGYGRRHGVYVVCQRCQRSTVLKLNVVCMCVFVCVIHSKKASCTEGCPRILVDRIIQDLIECKNEPLASV